MVVALWAGLGLLVAALLNHLADRLPQHQALRPGPGCLLCGQAYRPGQWLALVAMATREGRCRQCGAPLPARRWLFEAGLALLYAALAWRYGLSGKLLVASFHASVLALITVTDLEKRLVPNAAVLPAMVVALALTLLSCPRCLPNALLGGGLGFGAFLVMALVYSGAMGFGDVKLAGYIGLIAGYPRVIAALLVGILAGGLGAAALLISRRGTRRSYMPYAPYLALGGAAVLFFL